MPVDLFNPNDNVTGRDGGPYLDEVEARNAEARRAVVEKREPDFDNPPATAGIPLLTGGRIAHVNGVNNLPSQAHRYDLSNADLVQGRADSDKEPGFRARGKMDVIGSDEVDEVDEEFNSHDPNAITTNNTRDDADEDTSEPEDFETLGLDADSDPLAFNAFDDKE